jgi:AraC family L-rhamnose operon transcriptional activator RhaR
LNDRPVIYQGKKHFKPGDSFSIVRFNEYMKGKHIYHSHDFVEICYVLEGTGYHVLENDVHPVTRGDLFIINYDVSHTFYRENEEEPLITYNILFKPEFIDIRLIDFNDFNSLSLSYLFANIMDKPMIQPDIRLNYEESLHFESLIEKMYFEYTEYRPGSISLIRAYLIELIIAIMRYFDQNSRSRDTYKRVQVIDSAINYLKENYSKSLSLNDLAAHSFLSKNYFCKLFKETTGTTVTEYIQKLRVEEACKRLKSASVKMADIALDVGFGDYKTFYTSFTRIVGMSPSEYRNRCLKR